MNNAAVEAFNSFTRNVFDLRNSYQGQVIKWVLICYVVVLVTDIVMIAIKHPNLLDYMTYGTKKPTSKKDEGVKRQAPATVWELVSAKLNSVNPNDWKIAVIDADKMLDEALKTFGASGETMGERLRSIVPGDVDGRLDEIWDAHKIRNQIVHDPAFELTNESARKTAKILEEAAQMLAKK